MIALTKSDLSLDPQLLLSMSKSADPSNGLSNTPSSKAPASTLQTQPASEKTAKIASFLAVIRARETAPPNPNSDKVFKGRVPDSLRKYLKPYDKDDFHFLEQAGPEVIVICKGLKSKTHAMDQMLEIY